MRIFIVTVFPEVVRTWLSESMYRKASECNAVRYEVLDLRDFTTDRHRQVDDAPFGGGAGMVMKPEPFFRAYDFLQEQTEGEKLRVIFPTPQGEIFHHRHATAFAEEANLVFFCGHYKGVDERVIEKLVSDEISIGDYVLTGGELPALVIIDSVIRHLPGVLNSYESAETDSLVDALLEGPIYTRPQVYRGLSVPDVLVSGNHAKIAEWRQAQRIQRTEQRRKDLLQSKNEDIGG